jgi:hypothetical protein
MPRIVKRVRRPALKGTVITPRGMERFRAM